MNTTTTRRISSSDDIIDVRDIIARVEELRDTLTEPEDEGDEPEREELKTLVDLLADLCGNGGDEQYKGNWYPVTLIRESYFEDYARELAEDIGAVPRDLAWPACHIDWEAASEALLQDYTSTEFEGITFYYR